MSSLLSKRLSNLGFQLWNWGISFQSSGLSDSMVTILNMVAVVVNRMTSLWKCLLTFYHIMWCVCIVCFTQVISIWLDLIWLYLNCCLTDFNQPVYVSSSFFICLERRVNLQRVKQWCRKVESWRWIFRVLIPRLYIQQKCTSQGQTNNTLYRSTQLCSVQRECDNVIHLTVIWFISASWDQPPNLVSSNHKGQVQRWWFNSIKNTVIISNMFILDLSLNTT